MAWHGVWSQRSPRIWGENQEPSNTGCGALFFFLFLKREREREASARSNKLQGMNCVQIQLMEQISSLYTLLDCKRLDFGE